jgi:tellurite resistance protein TerC
VKLILHALHEDGIGVIEIGTWPSLLVIVSVLVVTVVASLRSGSKEAAQKEPEPVPVA